MVQTHSFHGTGFNHSAVRTVIRVAGITLYHFSTLAFESRPVRNMGWYMSMTRTRTLPEKFLHEVWAQQLLKAGDLSSHEGHRVIIIEPGTPNPDAGPDFINAKIQIGDVLYVGDVEIHRSLDDWVAHLHHNDPRYNTVILHVVMKSGETSRETLSESGRKIPTLILDQFLIEPVHAVWQKSITAECNRKLAYIPCYGKNGNVPQSTKLRWLSVLGFRRIELKVRSMQNRLNEIGSPDHYDLREPVSRYGELPLRGNVDEIPPPLRPPSRDDIRRKDVWEQLLYESIAEALGYSKNQIQFRRLAARVTFPRLREIPTHAREAYMFTMAGLLTKSNKDEYVRKLQDIVRAENLRMKHEPMDNTEWQFFRLRPQNFPTLRIGGLTRIVNTMIEVPVLEWLIDIVKSPERTEREKIREIRSYFTVPSIGYWRNHYTFGKKAKRPITHLVGKSRVDEILINVLIPFLFLYARTYRDVELRSQAELLLTSLPAPSANAITRKIDRELGIDPQKTNSAPIYQGKIQLFKFYCREERCTECEIGKVIVT